jgi:hypothetical protein
LASRTNKRGTRAARWTLCEWLTRQRNTFETVSRTAGKPNEQTRHACRESLTANAPVVEAKTPEARTKNTRKSTMKNPSITAALSAAALLPTLIGVDALRALSSDDLVAQIKSSAVRQSSAHFALGKMLVILDESRDCEKHKTLKGYVRKMVGEEIEPASYKVANAFALVGEGHGTITEAQFDGSALNWLLTVSAILNFLEKHDDDTGARVREAVAILIRQPTEKTGKALKAIKDSLKPEAEGGEGEGGDAENVVPIALDFLTADHMRTLRDLIADCDDTGKLETVIKGFRALHSVAVLQLRAVKKAAAEVPAEAIAA